jgi:hypothetical protein
VYRSDSLEQNLRLTCGSSPPTTYRTCAPTELGLLVAGEILIELLHVMSAHAAERVCAALVIWLRVPSAGAGKVSIGDGLSDQLSHVDDQTGTGLTLDRQVRRSRRRGRRPRRSAGYLGLAVAR